MMVKTLSKPWFGHPRGLSVLFFAELWERFGHYGARALLVLFMVDQVSGMGLDRTTAIATYSLYGSLVYLSALPGAWLADRLLGQRRAVFVGGCIIAAGHGSLALLSTGSFYLGLSLIALGTGLLKPSITVLVGDLYGEQQGQRDAGFSMFYMGINLGAFLGPIVCGYLGRNVDWRLGFGAAALAMVFGLAQYQVGKKHLLDVGMAAEAAPRAWGWRGWLGVLTFAGLALLAFVMAAPDFRLTSLHSAANAGLYLTVAVALSFFAYQLFLGGLDPVERRRMLVLLVFFLAAGVFWAGFEQARSTLNLMAARDVDRGLGSWQMPLSWLLSIHRVFILLLAPLLGWLWLWLRARNPSTTTKLAAGLGLLGAGFLVAAWAAVHTAAGQQVGAAWLVAIYFFHTCGELCLSPVGMSGVSRLAPRHAVGQCMAVWFMSLALGNVLAGLVGGHVEPSALFLSVARNALVAAALLLLLRPLLVRWSESD